MFTIFHYYCFVIVLIYIYFRFVSETCTFALWTEKRTKTTKPQQIKKITKLICLISRFSCVQFTMQYEFVPVFSFWCINLSVVRKMHSIYVRHWYFSDEWQNRIQMLFLAIQSICIHTFIHFNDIISNRNWFGFGIRIRIRNSQFTIRNSHDPMKTLSCVIACKQIR